jgi:hypothetical protein
MNPILKNIKRLRGKLHEEVEKSRLTGEVDEMEWAYALDIQRVQVDGYIDSPLKVANDLLDHTEEDLESLIRDVIKFSGQVVFCENSGGCGEFLKFCRVANAFASMRHFAYGSGMGVVNYADGVLGTDKNEYQEYLRTENLVVHDWRLVDSWQNQVFGHFLGRRVRMGLTTFVTVRRTQGLTDNFQAFGESFEDIPESKIRVIVG